VLASARDRNLRIAKNSVIGLVFRIVKRTRGRKGRALMRVMLQLRARVQPPRAFRCAFPFRGGCEILEAYAAVATRLPALDASTPNASFVKITIGHR
jgi:hypothetical protein